jgi:hypothetical protein
MRIRLMVVPLRRAVVVGEEETRKLATRTVNPSAASMSAVRGRNGTEVGCAALCP